MKRVFVLLCALPLLLLTLTGCGNTEPEPLPVSGAMPPMLFVDDMLYFPGVAPWYIPALDADWTFIGEVQSHTAHHNTIPTAHLQSNSDHMLGARVYHAPYGRIRISRSHAGYSYREFHGDSLIVIVNGVTQHYISEEASNKVSELLADGTW